MHGKLHVACFLVLRLTVNCIVARTGAHFYRFAIGGRIDAIGGTCYSESMHAGALLPII